ncbi:hypothetical protein TSAR_004112 [Trichomalopsis sarcophagae]|uniref:Reverse transcriptase domain-containing protein n=1 Tax=Trichomalopsis sarcophagae TaxID=543379 RepID=A0A232EQD7_9HYME|nr:hypothetical protein TSAR_004112 [Trichomalopsis sarcophagae]
MTLFTNTYKTQLIFKYLPNKISSGLDNIPPIVLKHLPVKIIKDNIISTTHALHKVTNDMNTHPHNGLVVGACLVDLENAFDSVWMFGLLFILS